MDTMQHRRLPPWIRQPPPTASSLSVIRRRTYDKGLSTVCREARCPNQGECFRKGTATFLILGDRCTRNCRFCAVSHGPPVPLDREEPGQVAESVARLGLKHAVVTSVTRDDLPDGGASMFAATIGAIRSASPGTSVEVLVPDFQGSRAALMEVVGAGPEVINHNLETVPRLYESLRSGASYDRSVELLRRVRQFDSKIVTKSGIMVGVGETQQEVLALVRDLVDAGCRVLTIGQYLRPTKQHHPVDRYVTPEEFEELRELALGEGIEKVASGPLVRSSYRAGDILNELGVRVSGSDHAEGG
ncbi:MAG: lipoyl synthase [Deltaproteobacteria bacterium]